MGFRKRRLLLILCSALAILVLWYGHVVRETHRVLSIVATHLRGDLEGIGYNGPREKLTVSNPPRGTPASYFVPIVHSPETEDMTKGNLMAALSSETDMPPFKIADVRLDFSPGDNHGTLYGSVRIEFCVFPGVNKTMTVTSSIPVPQYLNAVGDSHY